MLSERTTRQVYEAIAEGIPLYFMQNLKWYKSLNDLEIKEVAEIHNHTSIKEAKEWLKVKYG